VKKPIEYPKQILKVLYEHYKETGGIDIELKVLRERSCIPDANLYNALRIVMGKGWIEPRIDGQPCFTYITGDGSLSIVTLSAKGISVGQELMRPRYQKVRNLFRKYCAKIIIGIAITVVASLIIHFLWG